MSDKAHLVALSKVLSKVLRHEPELVGIKLDAQGYVDVHQLVDHLNTAAAARPGQVKRLRVLPRLTVELLQEVVATSDKARFTFSVDGRRIRAAQGHSIKLDLGYPTAIPPEVLFHGTAAESWHSIERQGLLPMGRNQVHLSVDAQTARQVGRRHGTPLVLEVASGLMTREAFRFHLADNGIWLVDHVPPRFLTLY